MQQDRITIRGVDTSVANALRHYAAEHRVTLGECVTDAIQDWLATRPTEPTLCELISLLAAQLAEQQRVIDCFMIAIGYNQPPRSPQVQ